MFVLWNRGLKHKVSYDSHTHTQIQLSFVFLLPVMFFFRSKNIRQITYERNLHNEINKHLHWIHTDRQTHAHIHKKTKTVWTENVIPVSSVNCDTKPDKKWHTMTRHTIDPMQNGWLYISFFYHDCEICYENQTLASFVEERGHPMLHKKSNDSKRFSHIDSIKSTQIHNLIISIG